MTVAKDNRNDDAVWYAKLRGERMCTSHERKIWANCNYRIEIFSLFVIDCDREIKLFLWDQQIWILRLHGLNGGMNGWFI